MKPSATLALCLALLTIGAFAGLVASNAGHERVLSQARADHLADSRRLNAELHRQYAVVASCVGEHGRALASAVTCAALAERATAAATRADQAAATCADHLGSALALARDAVGRLEVCREPGWVVPPDDILAPVPAGIYVERNGVVTWPPVTPGGRP